MNPPTESDGHTHQWSHIGRSILQNTMPKIPIPMLPSNRMEFSNWMATLPKKHVKIYQLIHFYQTGQSPSHWLNPQNSITREKREKVLSKKEYFFIVIVDSSRTSMDSVKNMIHHPNHKWNNSSSFWPRMVSQFRSVSVPIWQRCKFLKQIQFFRSTERI